LVFGVDMFVCKATCYAAHFTATFPATASA